MLVDPLTNLQWPFPLQRKFTNGSAVVVVQWSIYLNDPSSNPTEDSNFFFCKIVWKTENIYQKEADDWLFMKKVCKKKIKVFYL